MHYKEKHEHIKCSKTIIPSFTKISIIYFLSLELKQKKETAKPRQKKKKACKGGGESPTHDDGFEAAA